MSEARRITDQFFFAHTGMDPDRVTKIVTDVLRRADGGELFLQRTMDKEAYFSDGRLEGNSEFLDQGFGIRFITGESAGYAHSQDLTEDTIRALGKSTQEIRKVASSSLGYMTLPSGVAIPRFYTADNPLDDVADEDRIKLLEAIEKRAREKDSRVIQVSAGISTEWSVITIIRRDGQRFDDVQPMSSISVDVVMEDNGHKRSGVEKMHTRQTLSGLLSQHSWETCVDEAVRRAEVSLRAVPAPKGEMPVVLGNGVAAVMLHESVGHGLEGDSVRKNASVYKQERLGKRVASKGVTIVDQGNLEDARGSLHFDDEGNVTQRNVLIEDGILCGYMQDSINARLMSVKPTGNGRRQGYQYLPMPRMTTTFMEAGQYDPAEIIASVDHGVYAVTFSGGEVDPVSGDYVFVPTEAYIIRDGKIAEPIEDAVLIGNGPRSMRMVDMVGNDKVIALGGTCGKEGQSVPVGLGQPTVKMRGIKVGGTQPS